MVACDSSSSESKSDTSAESAKVELKVASPTQPEAAPEALQAADVKPEKKVVQQPQITTKILSQGRGKKAKLRYQFKAGQRKRFSIQQVTRSSGKMNGEEMPGSGQAFQMTLVGESNNEAPDADGLTTRRTKFSSIIPQSPGAPPEMMKQLRESFQAAIGVTLSEKLNPRGELKGVSADMPLNAPPQLQQLLNGLRSGIASALIPLPEEALGSGAQWTSTINIDNMGRKFAQTSTFSVVSFKKSLLKLKVALEMKAPAQKATPPGAPPGTEIELLKYEGSGSGTIAINLETLDCELEMKQASTEKTKVTSPQSPEPIVSESTTEVSLKLTQKD